MSSQWYVYLLECNDGTFYTGVTNNIERRMIAHTNGTGSKYVFAKGLKRLIASKACQDKSEACKQEYAIKQLSKENKLLWFTH